MFDIVKKIKRQYVNSKIIGAVTLTQSLLYCAPSLFCFLFGKGKAYFPINITLDLTYRCNLLCSFCFINFIPHFDPGEISSYLRYEELEKLVRSLKDRNTSFFITGGEPLLRDDLCRITALIKRNGFRCGIFTNATLLNDDIARELVKLQLDYLFFSLDGSREIHDQLRGRQGSFDKTCGNIKRLVELRCKQKRPKIIMNSLILDKNLPYLYDVVDIAAELKVDCLAFDFLTFLSGKGDKAHSQNYKAIFPHDAYKSLVWVKDFNEEGFKELSKTIENVKRYARKQRVTFFFKPDLGNRELKDWFSEKLHFHRMCIYPWNVLRISPQGDVYPCAAFYLKMGNVKNSRIEEIWNNSKFASFRKLLKKEKMLPGCNRCVKL